MSAAFWTSCINEGVVPMSTAFWTSCINVGVVPMSAAFWTSCINVLHFGLAVLMRELFQ